MTRNLLNFAKGQPYELSAYQLDVLMKYKRWTMEEKIEVIRGLKILGKFPTIFLELTLEDMQRFTDAFFVRGFSEMLVTGNFVPGEVVEISEEILVCVFFGF
jgi:hypothetical protein